MKRVADAGASSSLTKKFRWCEQCAKNVASNGFAGHLRKRTHRQFILETIAEGVELVRSSFKSRMATYKITNLEEAFQTPAQFLDSKQSVVTDLCFKQLKIHKGFKVNCEFFSEYILPCKSDGGDVLSEIKSFCTKFVVCARDNGAQLAQLAEENSRVTVIPNTKEKYISFSRILKMSNGSLRLQFVDSYKFLDSSLDKLVSNLEKNQFNILSQHYDGAKFDLLRRKGVFPYEYIDSHKKFEEISLPPKEAFYSHIYDANISDADYAHAREVWREFEIPSLGDYSDLYLKSDVLLLADIFENFRKVCVKIYGLDPCQYLTAPSLSWDAMLKTTKIKLELISDYEMIEFIKSGIRGGVCQATHRYARANNKYMTSHYVREEESKYIVYLDANNLYGWAMSQSLPIDGFRWLDAHEIESLDIESLDKCEDIGHFLEVDLDYPDNLHDYHNDFPFCAQNKVSPVGKNKKLIITN